MKIAVLALAVLAILVGIWVRVTRDRFTRLSTRAEAGLADIEAALRRRYDMLTRLVDTFRGYMGCERGLLKQTVHLREGMDIRELNRAEAQINELSARMFAVAENYPEFCSSDVFTQLQQGIFRVEEDLQAAQGRYNRDVSAYNAAIALFPANMLAGKLSPKEFFRTEDSRKAKAKIKF